MALFERVGRKACSAGSAPTPRREADESAQDFGDEENNVNGTSSTTCKIYEGLKLVYALYDADFVWRQDNDSYLNLQMWFDIFPSLPKGHLYYGNLRVVDDQPHGDLNLARRGQLEVQSHVFHGLKEYGPYMSGMGYMLSFSVVEFLATATIPPKLMWCEDVMVGMWLLPFDVQWVDSNKLGYPMLNRDEAIPFSKSENSCSEWDILLVHYMEEHDWAAIEADGTISLCHDSSVPWPTL